MILLITRLFLAKIDKILYFLRSFDDNKQTNFYAKTDKKRHIDFFTCLLLFLLTYLIRPFTPRHNGKVERSHRKDNEYFYASHRFYSFVDFKKQLAVHSRKYNDFPMRPLGWKSPREYLQAFLDDGEIFSPAL